MTLPLPTNEQKQYESATHCTGSTDCPKCSPNVAQLKRVLLVDDCGNPVRLPEHKADGTEVPEPFSDAHWEEASPRELLILLIGTAFKIAAAAVACIGIVIVVLYLTQLLGVGLYSGVPVP